MPPGNPPVSPHVVASSILALLNSEWDQAVSSSNPLPEHQYVAAWTPIAYDCEQLVVQVERAWPHEGGLIETPQNRIAHLGFAMRAMTVAIHLVRCLTVDPQVSADTMDAEAEIRLDDYRAVCQIIVGGIRDIVACNSAAFLEWTPTEAADMQGGISRWNLSLD